MIRGRALTVLGLVGTVPLLLTACSPSEASEPTPTELTQLPAGVEVELYQLRSDVAERTAQVRVINGSDSDLVVKNLTFEDDWFTASTVRDRESSISAGRTVDLRIALPESACEEEPDAAARTSRVTLEFTASGEPGVATIDLADPLAFTALVHEKECLRHDLAQLATLEWSTFTPSVAPAPAQLVLSLTPTGGTGQGELVQIETTNLLKFGDDSAAHPLGIDLTGVIEASDVVVPLEPLRCDAHAVMEDKRGTVFNVGVEVDGVSGVVEVAASEQMRGDVLRWVADWCGFGPGH
jgi:hypothetical protein